VTLLKYLPLLAGLTLIVGGLRIFFAVRARSMRALAAKWGLQYIGPPAPKWWNPRHPKICPPVPGWFSEVQISGRSIRQVFNVIDGNQGGVSILIFDAIIGEYRGGAGCTLIAFHTERNLFGIVKSPDRVILSRGWTILHGTWLVYLFSWIMPIRRLDRHLKTLRVGSADLVEKTR
jgi:hypothetical protein